MDSTCTSLCNAVAVTCCKLYKNWVSNESLFSSVSSTILKSPIEFCKMKVQQYIFFFRTQGLLVLSSQFPYSVTVKQKKPQGRVFV